MIFSFAYSVAKYCFQNSQTWPKKATLGFISLCSGVIERVGMMANPIIIWIRTYELNLWLSTNFQMIAWSCIACLVCLLRFNISRRQRPGTGVRQIKYQGKWRGLGYLSKLLRGITGPGESFNPRDQSEKNGGPQLLARPEVSGLRCWTVTREGHKLAGFYIPGVQTWAPGGLCIAWSF